jgi:hypothetical protein
VERDSEHLTVANPLDGVHLGLELPYGPALSITQNLLNEFRFGFWSRWQPLILSTTHIRELWSIFHARILNVVDDAIGMRVPNVLRRRSI